MNFNSMQWFDSSVLIWAGISLLLNGIIAYLWHEKFYLKLGLKRYQAIQRIHLNETPRLGGLILLVSLFGYMVSSDPSESITILKLILICLIPIMLIGLKEDLFHNVAPLTRLISLFFVAWLFLENFTGPITKLSDVPILEKLFLLQGGLSFFYILSMVTIANGMNLIDGVNGLCGAVSLSILSALLFVSYKTGDIVMLSLISSFIFLLISFILVNYPFGRIFLGDLGAYSLGLIVSMLTIILFGRHPEISPWGAVLILIYPATEITFSLFRRFIIRVSVFKPDTLHLHLKLYNFLRSEIRHKRVANALVMPALCLLWLYPTFVFTWAYQKPLFVCIGITFFITFYSIVYLLIPDMPKKLVRN
jgi:UDP-GlcNAc:undecaprenyl-phosphate/decaprenyl-phosphate GlcNAc-1-phosphate transferase